MVNRPAPQPRPVTVLKDLLEIQPIDASGAFDLAQTYASAVLNHAHRSTLGADGVRPRPAGLADLDISVSRGLASARQALQ